MRKLTSGFEPIEHTTDYGLKIWGDTLEELFGTAAIGMFSCMTELKDLKTNKHKTLVVKSNYLEELLIDWLNELNYVFTNEKILFNTFTIKLDKEKFVIKAKCSGEKINPAQRELYCEIKAVIFSDSKIKKTSRGYETTVLFDV